MKVFCRVALLLATTVFVASCASSEADRQASIERQRQNIDEDFGLQDRSSFFDLFRGGDSDRKINVNRYLWAASLDVLSFLPVEAADPFSGVIVTGWGAATGASTPYRATIYITQPALDARSLKLAVFRRGRGGSVPVSDEVAEQLEDAILTRARQLRVADNAR